MGIGVDEILLHPRLTQQGLDAAQLRPVVVEAAEQLLPFSSPIAGGAVVLIDWDHRLPSRVLAMRLHLFRDADARGRLTSALDERQQIIVQRDRYPEFDVPDFDDLPSDETYDAELSRGPEAEAGTWRIESMRLVSPWRRKIPPDLAERAASVVRHSTELAVAKSRHPNRPTGLGDVEAVALIPPCESRLPRWSIDVWWLTAFDGRLGKGWSFLVAIDEPQVVLGAREMSIRAG